MTSKLLLLLLLFALCQRPIWGGMESRPLFVKIIPRFLLSCDAIIFHMWPTSLPQMGKRVQNHTSKQFVLARLVNSSAHSLSARIQPHLPKLTARGLGNDFCGFPKFFHCIPEHIVQASVTLQMWFQHRAVIVRKEYWSSSISQSSWLPQPIFGCALSLLEKDNHAALGELSVCRPLECIARAQDLF